jgi:hypothetical protein
MPQMQVGAAGVGAELDSEFFAALKLLLKRFLRVYRNGVALEYIEQFSRIHVYSLFL